MKRYILGLLLTSTLLLARFEATASMECQAYNDMKHKKNSHSITLKVGQSYSIVKRHKGQYLTLIKGESPAQRWLEEKCFKKGNKRATASHVKKYDKKILNNIKNKTQSLLVLSWHNAFCETHNYKKECRDNKNSKSHLVLHGLWPQPRNNVYCNLPQKIVSKDKHKQWRELPDLDLKPNTIKLLMSYMPGYVSGLHKHEWTKHGTCYAKDENNYFFDALTLAREVDESRVGELFRAKLGKRITLAQIRKIFDTMYGVGAGKKVELKCKNGLATELWIRLGGKGAKLSELIRAGETTRSRCHEAIVDR